MKGAEAEVKEGTQGALMPSSAAADQRWEHKVELWKHPKVGCAWLHLTQAS